MKQLHLKICLALILMGLASLSFSNDKKTYRLEYNLKKNQTYKQKSQVDMETTFEVMGQKIIMNSVTYMDLSYHVKKSDADLFTFDFEYDNMRTVIHNNMGGTNTEIDSDKPAPEGSPFDFGGIFKAITGIPVEITMNKKGKVKSVNGVDKLMDAIDSAMDSTKLSTGTEQLSSQLKIQFSEASIKQQFEQLSSFFPEKDVTIGDTWDVLVETEKPYKISIAMVMKLTGVNGKIATIEGSGTVTTPGGSVMEQNGVKVSTNLGGTQSVVMQIDLNTGWTIGSDVEIEMEGESESMGMKMPISVKSTVKTTN